MIIAQEDECKIGTKFGICEFIALSRVKKRRGAPQVESTNHPKAVLTVWWYQAKDDSSPFLPQCTKKHNWSSSCVSGKHVRYVQEVERRNVLMTDVVLDHEGKLDPSVVLLLNMTVDDTEA